MSIPVTVRRVGAATSPEHNAAKVANVGAVKQPRNVANRADHEPGNVSNWSINGNLRKWDFPLMLLP
jgi:hypothetical protein